MSSMYLSALKLSIFGQSHGPCVGAVLDGLPAGEAVDLDALHAFLRRRAPGQSELTSARKEEDLPQLLSGLSQGVTCGAPLAIVLPNADARPGDYDSLRDAPRPGHADFTAHVKFKGFEDAAGGLRRRSALRAAFACKFLRAAGSRLARIFCAWGKLRMSRLIPFASRAKRCLHRATAHFPPWTGRRRNVCSKRFAPQNKRRIPLAARWNARRWGFRQGWATRCLTAWRTGLPASPMRFPV